MPRLVGLIVTALIIGGWGWLWPPSASALIFFKELVSEEAIPNAELKIDSQGNIHIVFLTRDTGEVKYAKRLQNAWVIEGSGLFAQWVSLALDGQDQVHIAFYDPGQSEVKYAQKTTGGWNTFTVSPAHGSRCRIAIDEGGQVYVAFSSSFYYINPKGLYLALLDPALGLKSLEAIEAGADIGYSSAFVLDAGGRPHLTYYDQGLEKLKYAFKNQDGWQVSIVDDAPLAGWQSALALDASGRPHVAYYDLSGGDFRYAYRSSWGWRRGIIDSMDQTGQYPALAFDPRGRLIFAYYNASLGDLRIAYKEGFFWKRRTLTQEGDVGYHIALGVNPEGEACLLYYGYDLFTGVTKLYYGVATLPRVYLTTPGGGEIWPGGSTQTIGWRANSPEILVYSLQFSTGFTWRTLANNLPADQKTYSWVIPVPSMVKNRCRLKLLGKGAGGKILATDLSPYFTLTP